MHAPPACYPITCDSCSRWKAVLSRYHEVFQLLDEVRFDYSATYIARLVGFGRGDRLERELALRGLPPFRLLRNWMYVVRLATHHRNGVSVAKLALTSGQFPAMYYRLIRSTTGSQWNSIKDESDCTFKQRALVAWSHYVGE